MSKKRNQVLFTRPDDPKFLKLIKQQAGYKDDGPTVDTKRQKFDENDYDSDYSDKDEELPQIVVVRSGDLSAEEAERERIRIETELNHKPADLSERIIFKSKSKTKPAGGGSSTANDDIGQAADGETSKISSISDAEKTSASAGRSDKKSKKASKETASKLSFAFEDDDDDEVE